MIEFEPGEFGSLSSVTRARDAGPSSTTSAVLESQLSEERAQRRCERFFWALAVLALLNVLLAAVAPIGASVVGLLFSLLIAIGLAKWQEVPFIVPHLERWFDKASATKGKQDTE